MDSSVRQDYCIDAHHHLWRNRDPGQPWMTEEMSSLRRDIGLDDLHKVAAASGITGTVVIEVERTAEETRWLASLAASDDVILGVVGWAAIRCFCVCWTFTYVLLHVGRPAAADNGRQRQRVGLGLGLALDDD